MGTRPTLCILGAAGGAREVWYAVYDTNPLTELVFIDDHTDITEVRVAGRTLPVCKDWNLEPWRKGDSSAFTEFLIGLGTPSDKKVMVEKALEKGLTPAPTLCDRTNILHPDVIWSCTSCRACEEQCPVNISYVDKIVAMRRSEYMDKSEFPHDLEKVFQALDINGNPWNLPRMDRGNWASDLDFEVPMVSDRPDAEVLYWVGCAANYDDQAKKVARSFASLMNEAGVDFAILGAEATCTGDPARRAGNEFTFQMLAEANVETLNGYGAADKTVVTACPHCFNTLANEYAPFGGKYTVKHHTELLRDLLDDGRLEPKGTVRSTVAFHDSCYLGRYNEVYDAPREVLESIPGVSLVEPEYWNRERGLCCGAGGAQMWKEEEPPRPGKEPQRVNVKRTLQLLDTGADTVASGCPFCMTMLTDGIKGEEKEDDVAQLDVAQILAKSVLGDE